MSNVLKFNERISKDFTMLNEISGTVKHKTLSKTLVVTSLLVMKN